MNVLNNEGGFFKFVFTIALIAFLIYAGIQFGMPYYRYSAFKSDAKDFARMTVGDPAKTRTQLFERAQELRLPLEEKDIEVARSNNMVQVKTSWSESVDLFGQDVYTFNFVIDVKE